MKSIPHTLPHLNYLELNLDNTLINDAGIYYISEALDKFGSEFKFFKITLNNTQVTESGMHDLFEGLKSLSFDIDVKVQNTLCSNIK